MPHVTSGEELYTEPNGIERQEGNYVADTNTVLMNCRVTARTSKMSQQHNSEPGCDIDTFHIQNNEFV